MYHIDDNFQAYYILSDSLQLQNKTKASLGVNKIKLSASFLESKFIYVTRTITCLTKNTISKM